MTIHIEENLQLEATASTHSRELYAAIDNNREHLSVFLPWVTEMQSGSDMNIYLEKCETRYQQGVEVSFMMRWQGRLVGRIGLQYIDELNKNASIGYWLTKDAEGHGIVSKSCKWLIDYGLNTLQLHRIEIETAVENTRSQAIPLKFGFKKEGILREADLVNGRFLDIAIYSLLKAEWGSAQNSRSI